MTFLVEYFVCNPSLGKDKPIYGQLKEGNPSYMMIKAGCWKEQPVQLHRFFAWNEVMMHEKAPFSMQAKDCFVSETEIRGSVKVSKEESLAHPEYMSDFGSMSWNLKVKKEIAFNVGYGTSSLFRALKAFEMYWHAEGMKSLYSGEVTLNGEKYIVKESSSYGYADKNWGRNFTTPWVWLASNDLKSRITGKKLENSAFDIGGGKPKIYFVPFPRKLLGAFYYEGKEYEFNFSKFWTLPTTYFDRKETDQYIGWHVRQSNRKYVMDTLVKCKKEDMLLVNYEAPDGTKRHNCLWNGGNGVGRIRIYEKIGLKKKLIDDIEVGHIGCEYGEFDTLSYKNEM